MTDKAIFLFENKPNDKMTFTAIGEPAAGWPEATLELCPGTRSADRCRRRQTDSADTGERPPPLRPAATPGVLRRLMQSRPILWHC